MRKIVSILAVLALALGAPAEAGQGATRRAESAAKDAAQTKVRAKKTDVGCVKVTRRLFTCTIHQKLAAATCTRGATVQLPGKVALAPPLCSEP